MVTIKNATEDEILEKYEDYLKGIEEDGYKTVPCKSRFADSIGVSRQGMYRWCSLHPHADAKMKAMTADTIASGAMLKKYVPAAAQFALKNWCGWEDSPKVSKAQANRRDSEDKKAKQLLDEYIKEQRPILDGGKRSKKVGATLKS